MARELGTRESTGQAGMGGRSLLTPRQVEVIGLARQGKSSKEIAKILDISKRTVDEYFDEARQRTGAVNRSELIALAGVTPTIVLSQSVPDGSPEHRGRPRAMTEDLIDRARKLLGTCSVTEIARKLGVSRTTLYVHMDEIKGSSASRQR